MKTGVSCADAMTTKPVKVDVKTSIIKCAKIMKKQHVGALLVVDGDCLKGILTEQDIVRRIIALEKDFTNLMAKNVISSKLYFASPNLDIFDALLIMKNENIRHVPIIEDKKLLGLVTAKDVLKLEPQLFELLAEKIELKEAKRKPLRLSEGNCEVCGEFVESLFYVNEKTLCKKCMRLERV